MWQIWGGKILSNVPRPIFGTRQRSLVKKAQKSSVNQTLGLHDFAQVNGNPVDEWEDLLSLIMPAL